VTTTEITTYGVVGLLSVVLAAWSLSRQQDRPPQLFKGYVLLSLTLASLFLFILARAWSTDELGATQFFFAALAGGLFSAAAALIACQACLVRRDSRKPPG
jgi:hypothetical protein